MLVVNDDPESCTEKVEGKGSKGEGGGGGGGGVRHMHA